MAVAVGELRRKREAMDNLVSEISKGEEENITTSIRIAIEVQNISCLSILHLITNFYSARMVG
jgi:hypothetical protein